MSFVLYVLMYFNLPSENENLIIIMIVIMIIIMTIIIIVIIITIIIIIIIIIVIIITIIVIIMIIIMVITVMKTIHDNYYRVIKTYRQKHEQAFKNLEQSFSSEGCVSYFYYHKETFIYTDSSP